MDMQLPNRPQKSRDETIDGRDVTFRLYDQRIQDHDAVIEIEAGSTWIFGVDDGEAELIEADSPTTDLSIPKWCRDALEGAGVAEVSA